MSIKVMIIDDSNTIRRTAEALLKKAGYDVNGSKPIAEAPNVATAAAISNAIAKLVGRPVRLLPMTAERVWETLHEEGA